jgi:hypothetical protein
VPVTYTLDIPAGLVRTRCRGAVTLPEVLEHFDMLASDRDRPPRMDVLLDLRGDTSLPSSAQLRTAAEKMRSLRPSLEFGVCAVLVDSDTQHATAMLFQVAAARAFTASRIFRDLYEAERWLKTQREPDAGG